MKPRWGCREAGPGQGQSSSQRQIQIDERVPDQRETGRPRSSPSPPSPLARSLSFRPHHPPLKPKVQTSPWKVAGSQACKGTERGLHSTLCPRCKRLQPTQQDPCAPCQFPSSQSLLRAGGTGTPTFFPFRPFLLKELVHLQEARSGSNTVPAWPVCKKKKPSAPTNWTMNNFQGLVLVHTCCYPGQCHEIPVPWGNSVLGIGWEADWLLKGSCQPALTPLCNPRSTPMASCGLGGGGCGHA